MSPSFLMCFHGVLQKHKVIVTTHKHSSQHGHDHNRFFYSGLILTVYLKLLALIFKCKIGLEQIIRRHQSKDELIF